MAKAREIKTRIKAVGNIERITNTMKMIATARFQASQRRATAAQPYTRKIRELVGELASASGEGFTHPLMKAPEPKTGRELLLVLTSNRGLCGAYNANILRTAAGYWRQREENERTDLEVVGKKGIAYFKFRGIEIVRSHSQFGDQPAFEDVASDNLTANRLLDRGNPTPGNIGSDFNRLGFQFWDKVINYSFQNERRRQSLVEMNAWRNAIAHHDFDPAKLKGRVSLQLRQVQAWKSSCNQLARSFDFVLQKHVQSRIGALPW